MKGKEPRGAFLIDATACNCFGLLAIKELNGLTESWSRLEPFGRYKDSGKRRRGEVKETARAWCWRHSGILFNLKRCPAVERLVKTKANFILTYEMDVACVPVTHRAVMFAHKYSVACKVVSSHILSSVADDASSETYQSGRWAASLRDRGPLSCRYLSPTMQV